VFEGTEKNLENISQNNPCSGDSNRVASKYKPRPLQLQDPLGEEAAVDIHISEGKV
jgi:hypothetical protein